MGHSPKNPEVPQIHPSNFTLTQHHIVFIAFKTDFTIANSVLKTRWEIRHTKKKKSDQKRELVTLDFHNIWFRSQCSKEFFLYAFLLNSDFSLQTYLFSGSSSGVA